MFSVSFKGTYFKTMINWIIIQRFYQTIFHNLPLTLYCLYNLSHPSHHPSFNPLPHLSHYPLRPWASTWLKSSFRAEPPPTQIRQCVCLFVCYPCTILFRCRNVCHWVLVSMECQTWHLKTSLILGYCTLLCTERLNKTLYMFLKIGMK